MPRYRSRSAIEPGRSLEPVELALALLLVLGAALAYALCFQERLYTVDAALIVEEAVVDTGRSTNALLYLPVLRALAGTTRHIPPLLAARLLSFAAGGVGVGASYLLSRLLGNGRSASLVATLLLAVTPAVWFFSTTIETHALHFAAVASTGALTLALAGSSRRVPRVPRALLGVLLFPLGTLTHLTGLLLLPGWVLLFESARRPERAEPTIGAGWLPWWSLARTAACLTAVLLVAVVLADLATGATGAGFVLSGSRSPWAITRAYGSGDVLPMLWEGWLAPLGLLVPLALLGLCVQDEARGRTRDGETAERCRRLALLLLVGFPFAALLRLSLAERGGYFLGCGPFLCALAARGLGALAVPVPRAAAAAALVLLQGVAATAQAARYDSLASARQRVERLVAATGGRGVLLSLNPNAPNLSVYWEGIVEIDLSQLLGPVLRRGEGPERFAQLATDGVDALLERYDAVLLDRSYRFALDGNSLPTNALVVETYLLALEAALLARFRTEHLLDPSWPLLRIERRPIEVDDPVLAREASAREAGTSADPRRR